MTLREAPSPGRRRSPRLLAALAWLLASAGSAMAHDAAAPAPEGTTPASFPHVSVEVDMNLYGLATPATSARRREGTSGFLFGHINPAFHLTPEFSIQAMIHPDPASDYQPTGSVGFLRRQNVILEQLFAEWRPAPGLRLFGGKFNAPFGQGHDYFPGVLASFRAHDVYLIREQLGVGASWDAPLPPAWGSHTLSMAVFTQDTTLLSNSLITRARCCDPGFERYVRTTLRQDGPGNDGRLDNFSLSLDSGELPALPGLGWNLGLLSRAPGKQGTHREWAWAAGLRYEHAWNDSLRGMVFGEYVAFYNAGGRAPAEAADGIARPLAEQRHFFTLGAQLSQGPWRATLTWQQEQTRRNFNPLPTERWLEASVGREIGGGFGLDAGYQHARLAQEDRRVAEAHSIVARLNYHLSH